MHFRVNGCEVVGHVELGQSQVEYIVEGFKFITIWRASPLFK
jgi:hypothetical protein